MEGVIADGFDVPIFDPIQLGILILFTFELITKFVADGWTPLRFFAESWNVFDFVIVFVSWANRIHPLGPVTVLRLLRLLRVVRLLLMLPSLQSVVQSLLYGFGNVGYVMVMVLLVNFVFAAIGMLMFKANDPQHFGHFSLSMMTIWRVETLDGWDSIMYVNVYGCERGYFDIMNNDDAEEHLIYFPAMAFECTNPQPWGWIAALFFVFVVLLGGMVMPTVLIGVISIAFDKATAEMKVARAEGKTVDSILKRARSWDEHIISDDQVVSLKDLFDLMNLDKSSGLCRDEILPLMRHVASQILHYPITDDKLIVMYKIIDTDADNDVSWPEVRS